MKTSESIAKIATAFLKAQKNIGAATKGASNPFFKSKYADLGAVMEACKEALNNEGIAVLQPPAYTDVTGKHIVETILMHESGEYFAAAMALEVPKSNMQDLGSAISYARRYGLQSLVFIPAEDDDAQKITNGKQFTKKMDVLKDPATPEIKKSSFKQQVTASNGASSSPEWKD